MIQDGKLTTLNNPYNPFTQWDAWYAFDTHAGFNTVQYVSRLVGEDGVFEGLSLEYAQAEIVQHNLSGQHVIVTADTFDAIMNTQP